MRCAAIDRLLESDPPQLMHKKRAQLITTGTIDDDFDKLADCDLVIEAVIEQLPVKQALYKRLHQTISPNCIVTSNTSTIPISLLIAEMPLILPAGLQSHIISIRCALCGFWSLCGVSRQMSR